ncbi:MAG: DUF4363 family protein [Oscillospiraceae bacterium]|nr:DUF4363 family protein [Oscillospiraceae bacterium]
MTKRIVLGSVCVIISVLLSISGWLYMKSAGNSLISSAEAALQSGEDTFLEKAGRAVEEWEKREKIVGVIVKHEDADNVDKLYLGLKYSIYEKDFELTADYLRQCITEIKVILTGEKPGWENVF